MSWFNKERTGKTYGRKPYIKGKVGDYTEMIKTVPRKAILDQRLEAKSQFDKPYLKDDYQAMEHEQSPYLPSLTNPGLNFSDSTSNPKGPVPEVPLKGPCMMFLRSPHKCCCKDYEDDRKTIHCTGTAGYLVIPMVFHPPKGGEGHDVDEIWSNAIVAYHNGRKTRSEYEYGRVNPYRIYPIDEEVGWTIGDKLDVYVFHQKGHVICEEHTTVSCVDDPDCLCDCDAPEEGVFTFDDDNTPDTIVAGGSIDVYVTGGCPPFSWAVAETGYTYDAAETSERVNTLNCDSGT